MCDLLLLTPRELDAIKVGLRMLLDAVPNNALLQDARAVEGVFELLPDPDVHELLLKLSRQRVEVWIHPCRREALVRAATMLRTAGERPPAPIDPRD